MSNRLPLITAATATVFYATLLQAQIVVDVGANFLLENTPNQTIRIQVQGGVAVGGLNFNVQIADGFPDVPSSATPGPKLTGVDIIGTSGDRTIFFGNNTGQQNPNSPNDFDQIRFRTTTANSGTVSANGLLAILTIDTTGFTSGTFDLRLQNVFGGPTTFLDGQSHVLPASINDGSITVVPEPISGGLVALALLGVAWVRRRYLKG